MTMESLLGLLRSVRMRTDLQDALLARGARGMILGLERMHVACSSVGNPERSFDVFHVGGTNGKGSVSAMTERALRAAGYRTGLYTSPHLSTWNERIAVDGAAISDEAFEAALLRVFADAPEDLTFFESLTLAGFVAFRDAGVEACVLEVGLGGRLDATNVIEAPRAVAITNITEGLNGRFLEHERLLGSTVAAIAKEKAAIMKPGRPAVIGPMHPESLAVMREASARVGARLIEVCEPDASLPPPSLLGPHQRINAAVAAALLRAGTPDAGSEPVRRVTEAHIAEGVSQAVWPGRMEKLVHRGKVVLLDGAHNIEGVRAFLEAESSLELPPNRVLVFGALADKAFAPMLELLAPRFARRFYVAPEGRPPAPFEELCAIAEGTPMESAEAAIERGVEDADAVVVLGSIYLIGAARAHLLGLRRDRVLGL